MEAIVLISEKIRILCAKMNISQAELARRIGQSPQNLNAKIKREQLSLDELQQIANSFGGDLSVQFVFNDGTEI